VLRVGHDSVFSCHLGIAKTLNRVNEYFYWPTVTQDVTKYVQSCVSCQLVARKTKKDMVPLKIVPRALRFGDLVHCDIFGAISPKSSAGHSFAIIFVDSATRWLEIEPLRTVSSKEVIDTIVRVCCRLGLFSVLVSDNGTCFTSEFARALYRRLGIEFRTCSAYHPEGNSLAERVIQSAKRMLHHLIHASTQNPRSWHLKLPFLCFAYREAVHRSVNASPSQLVFGRTFRGPLSVMHDAFAGKDVTQLPLKLPAAEYIKQLNENLALGLEAAQKHGEVIQHDYTDRYNATARSKRFVVGDMVLYSALFRSLA
jgi:hypothetical protein